MGEGYIPISEILTYGTFLQDDDMDKFLTVIRACDNAYLLARQKEQEQKEKSK